jgi:hypothetical protein
MTALVVVVMLRFCVCDQLRRAFLLLPLRALIRCLLQQVIASGVLVENRPTVKFTFVLPLPKRKE